MWILNFLPNWFFYAVLLAGIVGLISTYFIRFLAFIPGIYMYKTPIQLISIALIAIGTFMSGAIHDNESWLARVREMEEKVAAAEQESKKENVKIVTKVVTKTQIVRTRGEDIIKYVDREIIKYDTKFAPGGQCELPKEFIKAINDAAEPPK
jgi:flagellar biosynthesis component FlhA